MRYVGNMRRSPAASFKNQPDKAVFPPGSIVPEKLADSAVMYNAAEDMPERKVNTFRENLSRQESNIENVVNSVVSAAINKEDIAAHGAENEAEEALVNREMMSGVGKSDEMEFPLPSGGVLKRYEIPPMSCVGSVQSPEGFSSANNLPGRPMGENISQAESLPGNTVMQPSMTNEYTSQMNTAAGNSMQSSGMNRPTAGNHGAGLGITCGTGMGLADIICMYAGKNIDAEFLFGADTYVKKSGILSGAGQNFIILTNPETGLKTICDLSDMKFISLSGNSEGM